MIEDAISINFSEETFYEREVKRELQLIRQLCHPERLALCETDHFLNFGRSEADRFIRMFMIRAKH